LKELVLKPPALRYVIDDPAHGHNLAFSVPLPEEVILDVLGLAGLRDDPVFQQSVLSTFRGPGEFLEDRLPILGID